MRNFVYQCLFIQEKSPIDTGLEEYYSLPGLESPFPVMQKWYYNPLQCATTTAIKTIAIEFDEKLMKEKSIGSLIITNGESTEGLITDRDIICNVVAEGVDTKEAKLADYVNTSTENINQEDSIFDARELMLDKDVDYLLVQEKGKLVGIVSKHDLLKD